jgi:hypothetical protein
VGNISKVKQVNVRTLYPFRYWDAWVTERKIKGDLK